MDSYEMEQFTQHGSGRSFSFVGVLIYLVAMAVAVYFAYKYTLNETNNLKKYGIMGGALVGAWFVVFILRSMTINL